MSWSGKVFGGVFGGLLGGPVGAGLGVALGHYLGDTGGVRPVNTSALRLERLEWQHHVFSESGPGVLLTPVWRARGLRGVACRVRVRVGDQAWAVEVEPEHAVEECHLPEVHLPYALPGETDDAPSPLQAAVQVSVPGAPVEQDRFRVPMPSRVRQLGCSGPGRVVMALVASARAGGRRFSSTDGEHLAERIEHAHPLDERGRRWLSAWVSELCAADLDRLSPEKVAHRLAPHLDVENTPRVMRLLMSSARQCWPGEPQLRYVEALGTALGLSPVSLAELWAQLDVPIDPKERLASLTRLGLSEGASPEEIRAAWLALVRRYHPDRAATDEESARYTRLVARINAAYDVLTR